MNIDDFLDTINAKTWRKNKRLEAQMKVDQLLKNLQECREEMVETIVDSCEKIEEVKVEDNEEFNYRHFQKWLDYYAKSTIKSFVEDLNGTGQDL